MNEWMQNGLHWNETQCVYLCSASLYKFRSDQLLTWICASTFDFMRSSQHCSASSTDFRSHQHKNRWGTLKKCQSEGREIRCHIITSVTLTFAHWQWDGWYSQARLNNVPLFFQKSQMIHWLNSRCTDSVLFLSLYSNTCICNIFCCQLSKNRLFSGKDWQGSRTVFPVQWRSKRLVNKMNLTRWRGGRGEWQKFRVTT